MHCGAWLLPILLGCELVVGAAARDGQTKSGKDQLDLTSRYLLLKWSRYVPVHKLDQAAEAGYRVLAGVGCGGLVLEKAGSPPDTYAYRVLQTTEEVKAAGREGYRLVPLVRACQGGSPDTFVQAYLVEKSPHNTRTWFYDVTVPSGLREETSGAVLTYSFANEAKVSSTAPIVRMTVSATYFYEHLRDCFLITESADLPAELAGPATVARKVLAGRTVDEVRDPLNRSAADGWHVVLGAEGELGLLLEKPSEPMERSEYVILGTQNHTTMEKQLNEAGKAGFRLLPATVGSSIKAKGFWHTFGGWVSETFAVMERDPEPGHVFAYKLVKSQRELNQAGAAGYRVVCMRDFWTELSWNSGVVFLERVR
jgi:hypothetical protein